MDWNYFKYIEAIAAAGKLSDAADLAGIDIVVLQRHLQKIEKEYGTRIFKKEGENYAATREGREYVTRAIEMKHLVDSLPTATESIRSITLASLESFFTHYLLRRLPVFDFQIDFRELGRASTRDADVTLRFTRPVEGDLLIKELFRAGFAVYVNKGQASVKTDLLRSRWVSLGEESEPLDDSQWIRTHWKEADICYRATSYEQILQVIKSGGCAGILPCYIGDADPDLKRAASGKTIFSRTVWMITHQDSVAHPHIRKFKDWLAKEILRDKKFLGGGTAV